MIRVCIDMPLNKASESGFTNKVLMKYFETLYT